MRGAGSHAAFWTVLVLGLWGCLACSGGSDETSRPEESQPNAAGNGTATSGPSGLGSERGPGSTEPGAGGPSVSAQQAILADATRGSGIDFLHFNGTTGEYFLPEITGSGGALFDYDNDGDLDLYLVQGAKLTPGPNPPGFTWRGQGPPRDRLYRNDLAPPGDDATPRFKDVTRQTRIDARGYGMGVAAADFNGDGWEDLYITNVGPNQMLRNNGDGTFSDVTRTAGTDDPRWSTSATFFDYDRDGWLDLFVAHYVDFSPDLKRECYSKSSARDYCGPDAYDPIPDRLFRNQGGGRFEDVTEAAGLHEAFGAGLGVIAADFNADGWTDIYVANDGDPNQLWINNRRGGFEDEALLAGVALNYMGRAEAGMGVDAADFDGDGDEDLFMTHLDGESNTLYVNQGDGLFDDLTIKLGLHAPSLASTGFGTHFFDYDNDGRLDLLVLNGAVRLQERLARKGEPYPLQQPNQLFRNSTQGTFKEVSQQAGPAFKLEAVSRGAVFGDIDNDGDTDVVVCNNSGRARLLLNEVGNRHHWLGLRLLDAKGHDALQARVEAVREDGGVLWRRVHSDGSYCSANDPRLLAGLGESDHPLTVRVHWPRGGVEEWRGVPVDRYWVLQEGTSPRRR